MPSALSLPRLHPLALAVALTLPTFAQAQTAPLPPAAAASAPRSEARPQRPPAAPAKGNEQLQRVEISGGPSDDTVRRASTAARIVIGREEIERFGDSSIGEVLKRLPGVTTGGRPGRGGEIRMRGMGGGYTQILVNGERMPPGFSLDQLPPEQIERIEIMRAPTAEFGARAVAGTINVVLREALQRKLNELRLAVTAERDKLRPNFSWTRNDKLDEHGGAYNLTINAMDNKRRDDIDIRTRTWFLPNGPERQLHTQGYTEDERRALNMTARFNWRLSPQDQVSLQPFFVASRGSSRNTISQSELRALNDVGEEPAWDEALSDGDSRFTMMRLNGQWTHRFDEASRVELRGGVGRARNESHSLRSELKTLEENRSQDDRSVNINRSWSLNGKYSHQFENDHSLVVGLEGEGQRSDQTRDCQQRQTRATVYADCAFLLDVGDNVQASTQRIAVYAQDEWTVGKQWSFYAGLRWEGIQTESDSKNSTVSNRSGVATPLLHAMYKLDEKSREQIRMSLTRSYKSPNAQDLIAGRSISAMFPCPGLTCVETNTANSPDRVGNPQLKPELATGIDIAYEKYLTKGGVLSANFFVRRIEDLIRSGAELETVSWSSAPRWVSRPRNIGNARTLGVELEAKFRLDEYFEDAWPINVRSNVSVFRSKVEGIPGPDNKLDQQPDYTANLGADYRLKSLPLSLGASVNFTPYNQIQQSAIVLATTSQKRVLDAFITWAINRETSLRLSASNLAPRDYANGSITTQPGTDGPLPQPGRVITTENGGRTFTAWQLRLEMKI